jgi:NAD-dependent SIR2 family protein deacetylase
MAEIPRKIKDAMNERKCLFFIGSGMSTEAGLPSATDLTNILIEKLKSNGADPSSNQLKKVAQDFCCKYSRPDLVKLIRDEIVKKLETADRTSFKLLTNLIIKPKDIVTTNWDPLIEEVIGRKNYMPIFEPSTVANYSETLINLFKIHGDIDHDIVITDDDYRNYGDNWGPLITELKALFQKGPLCLLAILLMMKTFWICIWKFIKNWAQIIFYPDIV